MSNRLIPIETLEQAEALHKSGLKVLFFLSVDEKLQPPVTPPTPTVVAQATSVQGSKTIQRNRHDMVLGKRVLQWTGKKSKFQKGSKIEMAYNFFADYFLNMPVEERCATRTHLQKQFAEWAIINEKLMPEANYLTSLIQNGHFIVKK